MIDFVWNNWLVVVFLAPTLWALINLIDLYFIGEVYENAYEGAIVTGFIQLSIWFLVPFWGFTIADKVSIMWAMSAGFILIVAYFFYFKTFFKTSDASLVLILWNLTAIVTPLLAFLFLAERLNGRQYLGIGVVLIGVFVVSLHKNIKTNDFKKVIGNMMIAVLLYSIHMVVARQAYGKMDFYEGILFYSLGAAIGGLVFYLLNYINNHRNNFSLLGHCCHFFKTKKLLPNGFY